ncbi:NAD-dependent epimerase/dehydratase family protein [Rhodococcus erythropolis]|nr:NAD-dependent epimerase/dehydratase family protein [Rhodococcus erythropolis]
MIVALVTGGNGFLGTAVIDALIAQGITVVCADLTVKDTPDDRFRRVRADVCDPTELGRVFGQYRPNVVIHLASIVNPGKNTTAEQEYRVDVDGTRNVLAACVEHGVGRIVVSSSGAAYGYHSDNPPWITEDVPVRGNDEFTYSRHKRLVEEMLAEYRVEHPELEQVVFRIGTILGESVDNQITALFDRRKLLKVAGSDSPFVFVWHTDVAGAFAEAVTGNQVGIFNVAGDGSLTVDELASRMGKSTVTLPAWLLRGVLRVGRRLGVTEHGPERVGFLQYRPVLDNRRLKEQFGYVPEYSSEEAFAAYLASR